MSRTAVNILLVISSFLEVFAHKSPPVPGKKCVINTYRHRPYSRSDIKEKQIDYKIKEAILESHEVDYDAAKPLSEHDYGQTEFIEQIWVPSHRYQERRLGSNLAPTLDIGYYKPDILRPRYLPRPRHTGYQPTYKTMYGFPVFWRPPYPKYERYSVPRFMSDVRPLVHSSMYGHASFVYAKDDGLKKGSQAHQYNTHLAQAILESHSQDPKSVKKLSVDDFETPKDLIEQEWIRRKRLSPSL